MGVQPTIILARLEMGARRSPCTGDAPVRLVELLDALAAEAAAAAAPAARNRVLADHRAPHDARAR